MATYHIGFVIEQALGHITHTRNLQANVPLDPEIAAHWVLPSWDDNGLVSKTPLLRRNWTLRAGWQARAGQAALEKQGAIDALFFHTQVTAVLGQKWLRRLPSVVSLDATPRQYDRLGDFYAHQSGPAWLEKGKWRLNRDCFRDASRLVTWSYWARDGLVEEYEVAAEKVTVIPPGVNSAEWERPEPRRPHNSPVKILFVGGDLQRKGGLLLLETFRHLRQQAEQPANGDRPTRPVELHLVTREPVAPEPGLFVYTDMQPNSAALKQLYFDADIFCLPTYGDCLPMVLSEAGAAGLPVVSTRVAAIPELVSEGETGYLIEPGDGDNLAAALSHLVEDEALRARMGQRAVEVVRQGFDASSNATRLLALLKETAEAARREKGQP
jgi:glycosyltransferase involved in cell wall biosynthesis